MSFPALSRKSRKQIIAVIGLGYVGLPLAVEFGKTQETIGFDISKSRIRALLAGRDTSKEIGTEELLAAKYLRLTHDEACLRTADILIIAVPTPIDNAHRPDLGALLSATATVAKNMKRGCLVIYESTVYPGATEEVCVPELEKISGFHWRQDFHVGYSPERINPGDREHTLTRVSKVVAGDDSETLGRVAALYEGIVKAGVHRTSNIKVAEAAKVIENTQRDLNIALMNELAMIFKKMEIDTGEVIEAASTKWNFLPFKPGLVGGHCIGVDPYYLTHKALTLGHHTEIILAGRRINDNMGKYIANQVVKELTKAGTVVKNTKVIVLGLAFKENVCDIRNSKISDVIKELREFGAEVFVHDPMVNAAEAEREYGLRLTSWNSLPKSAAIIAAVSHRQYLEMDVDRLVGKLHPGGLFCDIRGVFDAARINNLGHRVWRL